MERIGSDRVVVCTWRWVVERSKR